MKKTALSGKSVYQDLVHDIQSTLQSGLVAAQKAIEYERLKTYWAIGRHIQTHVDQSKGALKISQALYAAIHRDVKRALKIDVAPNTLQRTIQFYKTYPKFPAKTPLTFTHYLALMRIQDARARQRMERKVIQENISSTALKDMVRALSFEILPASTHKSNTLSVERGEPYIYRVHLYKDITAEKEYRIDCGFKIDIAVPPQKPALIFRKPHTIKVEKKKGAYDVRKGKEEYDKLYTYRARIIKVVDGDTLIAHIDVGFGIWITERLRLKGINAPEKGTPEGVKAKDYLSYTFKKNPSVIIRTFKEGAYGRWLADIFIHQKSTDPCIIARKGEYLNQILLDKGLAHLYQA